MLLREQAMRCPHCSCNTAREVHLIASSDSLLRQSGKTGNGFISGISCLCGYWREPDFVAVMPDIPPKDAIPNQGAHPAEKTATYYIMLQFYDSIVAQLAQGASWYAVAKLLTQAGHRCKQSTLQKHFLLEQGKRCGDEKAT